MIGQLMLLDTGATVIITDCHGNGWWSAIVVHTKDPAIAVDGGTIHIYDADIERARTLRLTDGLVDMLAWRVPVNGPAPTIETVVETLEASAGVPAL